MSSPPRSERSFRPRARVDLWGRPLGWLGVLLVGAAALRILGWDNAPRPNGAVVRDAWELVNGGSKAHGAFAYVLVPSQVWRLTPWYDAARGLVLAIGVAGVAAAWWLGRAAYGTAAAFVAAAAAAVATADVAAGRQVTAAVPLAALCAVALALLAGGRIELAGAAAGLAAAIDYPGWLLLVPIAVVAWGAWRRLLVSAALAAILSAPAWLEAGHFADRFGGGRHGWVSLLWKSLGPVLALSAVGLLVAVLRRTRPDLAIGSFVVAYGVYLVALPEHRARYLLPVVAPLGALAGRVRSLVPVALLLLVLPLTWSIRDAREPRAKGASTMIRGERAGPPRSARTGGARAARVRLLEQRSARTGGLAGGGEGQDVQVPGGLAEAR